ncbi:MAG TPA: hypothetical protein VF256_15645 [Streptosporangiaceae bacterium]
MSSVLSPSEAAEQSGFSLDTLRYDERIALLQAQHNHLPGEDRLVPQPDTRHPGSAAELSQRGNGVTMRDVTTGR